MEKKEIILNEIKNSYQQELEAKQVLETKAERIITISGIILAILFGFSTINFTNGDNNLISKIGYMGIIVSIILLVVTIWYGFRISKVTKYIFMLSDDKKEKKLIEESIEKYEKMSLDNLINSLINDYVVATKYNSWLNSIKEKLLYSCEKWFWSFLIVSIISIILVIISKLI